VSIGSPLMCRMLRLEQYYGLRISATFWQGATLEPAPQATRHGQECCEYRALVVERQVLSPASMSDSPWIGLAAFAFGMGTLAQAGPPEGRTGCQRSRQEKPRDVGIASRVLVGNRGATRPRSRWRRDTSSCWNG
jgi:hypothetical protein